MSVCNQMVASEIIGWDWILSELPFCTAPPEQRNLVSGASSVAVRFLALMLYYWSHSPDIALDFQIWSMPAVADYGILAVNE